MHNLGDTKQKLGAMEKEKAVFMNIADLVASFMGLKVCILVFFYKSK